eukprot:TRINITY_DN19736_c0_g1_i1.p1 TRINITY_DN19736_c0_g1~~TRINITY_DN19736_c0_g1_i1.p1  ORF type:complete len:484 (-),score=45.24 TRINITY_DN19736_c0_g1_i1:26-1477(-)
MKWAVSLQIASILCYVNIHVASAQRNRTNVLQTERALAEELWRRGKGRLWLQHVRKAGGSSLCRLLSNSVPGSSFQNKLLPDCKLKDWPTHDAVSVCDHNFTRVKMDLEVFQSNSFSQEYGPFPGPALLGYRGVHQISALRGWVFIVSVRDPWERFWSQLKYEMETCLMTARFLEACIDGDFEAIGNWWSPTQHVDNIMGMPGAGYGNRPSLYSDNYYVRLFVNRTNPRYGPAIDNSDLTAAMHLLENRVSNIIILEDFMQTSLHLACTIGLDLEKARPHLLTKYRPYQEHEAMSATYVPEWLRIDRENLVDRIGKEELLGLRRKFIRKNRYDYALYRFAKKLAKKQLGACPASRAELEFLKENAERLRDAAKPAPAPSLPVERTIDDIFGCTGGKLEPHSDGQMRLICPRTTLQAHNSWWGHDNEDLQPIRKCGFPSVGASCWSEGFAWSNCCAASFGPGGNTNCWDKNHNYKKCCTPADQG